ncbi:hypothetical protein FRC12_018121 [Ceratobasidium sp. 428]|nr:hypothetical protein FRC12_018121 [Ceratobasidium sp. 428]
MPPGISVLKDVRFWVKRDVEAWATHLEKGQFGQLDESHVFQFHRVIRGHKGAAVKSTPLAGLTVDPELYKLTSAELLYSEGQRNRELLKKQPPAQSAQNWFPPAQTSHIYAPFTIDDLRKLSLLHSMHPELLALLREIACLEGKGPLHQVRWLCDQSETPNPHLSESEDIVDFAELTPALWLDAAFFDPDMEGHADWSVETLSECVIKTCAHIHQESGTVSGGPMGVCVPIFAVSRVLQNLERAMACTPVPHRL